jgi:hypothetical protein
MSTLPRQRPARATRLSFTLPLLLASALALTPPARAAEADAGFSAGLQVKPLATADEIGLPVYPGATAWVEGDNTEAGAQLSLWGGAFGLQMRVLKMRSDDRVDSVVRYYRSALDKQGPWIDCSATSPSADACGTDKPQAGAYVFKRKTGSSTRLVNIDALPDGTRVQLVRIDTRGE